MYILQALSPHKNIFMVFLTNARGKKRKIQLKYSLCLLKYISPVTTHSNLSLNAISPAVFDDSAEIVGDITNEGGVRKDIGPALWYR